MLAPVFLPDFAAPVFFAGPPGFLGATAAEAEADELGWAAAAAVSVAGALAAAGVG